MKKQQPKELEKQSQNFLTVINSKVEKSIILYESNITLESTLSQQNIKESIGRNGVTSQAILTAITFLVMRANKKEAIYKEMDDDTCFALAVDLLEIFQYDSIQDVSLMFKLSRTGKLKIDPMSKKKAFYQKVLTDYVPAYMELKARLREERHEENKKNLSPESWTPENRKKLRKLIEEVTPKKKPSPEFINRNSALENQEAFIAELKEDAKRTGSKFLRDTIKRWSKDNSMKEYVPILENELKSRNK